MSELRLVIAAALIVLACTARAGAQDASHERALRLFDESETAFGEGRFEAAAALLREAYALEPEPVLLYNLARSYEELDDLPHAIETYDAYAAAITDDAARDAALARRAALVARLPVSAPEPQPPSGSLDVVPPIVILVAGALTVVAAISLAIAADLENSRAFDPATTIPNALEAGRRRDTLATARDVCGGIGGTLVLGGSVWLLALPSASSSGVSASARMGGVF